MSNSFYGYYQYQDQPQVLIAPAAVFEQNGYYGDNRRSKSPASLINHSGLSPGPLTTPPPMSRNTSQTIEQAPDQMVWGESSIDSLSNSPNSIQTPDNESFEFEMLDGNNDDMRNFYHQPDVAMVSSQMMQANVPAIDTSMAYTISDQAMDEALSASIAAHQQQLGHYSPQYSQPQEAQPFNQLYTPHSYVDQPSRQDPWTSQRPPHIATVPRSGIVVFDPSSDPIDYSPFANPDVHPWGNDAVPQNYLLSPGEPTFPPQNNINYQNQTAVSQMTPRVTRIEHIQADPSPSPESGGFVNYTPSSRLFTEQYITESQPQPSSPVPNSNMMHVSFPSFPEQISRSSSNMGQNLLSPYQVAVSPQASVPSPGGSEGVLSYQHSNPDLTMEHYSYEHMDTKSARSQSPIKIEQTTFDSISGAVSDTTSTDFDNDYRSRSVPKGAGARPGGRALGTHLEPNVAKQAHDMRKIVACWHCVLQRDKCGPGDVCERCMKRSQRPNADCGLGCSRIKLVELSQYFLPTLVTQMHEDAQLTHFVSRHISQWGNQEITIHMTCGQKNMPRIPVKVYEFLANGTELLVMIQYVTDPATHKRVAVQKQSPALGMVHINHNEEKRYGQYISDIVDNHIDAFGELCWMEDDNDFQQKLFRLMSHLQPKGDDEAKLLREVMRLIVCTFIMSHTLSIAEETKHASLSKMHSYQGQSSYVENFTSPRMTNRQLKYFFNRLQKTILSAVLNKLQQILKSSKGCDKWLAAFIAVVGMCMAHEDQQKTIHLVMQTKATLENTDPREAQDRADFACREIDSRMGFIAQIFRWKYNRKCNPLRDADRDWDKEIGFNDPNSVAFIRAVAQLVKENIDFLQVRQSVSISNTNQTKYTSRLVGQFLLSFWLPQM